MNYGRKKAAKKRKDITSKSKLKKKRLGVRIFKGVLLTLLLLVVAGCVGGGIFIKKVINDAPDVTPEDVKPTGYTSVIYASDNKTETERLTSAGSNRVYKTIDEIPKDLQHAFVAIEDERFYEHNGIDPKGIIRAGIIGITTGDFSQGASTLTQQLIKNNIFDFMSEDTFFDRLERKIQEQYLALKLEKQMSKSEIMENYLNTINLGQNTLGVQAASQRYFNKDVSQLTLSECAVIAAITQSPSYYNPITHPDNNAKRREQVLDNMLDQGYISQEAHDEALADDVYSRIQNVNTNITQSTTPQSYFVDALTEQILNDLEDPDIGLGYSETQAYNTLYKGGLSIYSTQDLEIQGICDQIVNDDSNYPSNIEYGLSYALTVTRADGTQENYSSGHIKQFRNMKYGLTFDSEEEAYQVIEEFKASIAQEGDTYDEVIDLSPQPQASVTVIDQATGQIKAMVGGRGTKSSSMSLNRAYTGSTRQPGSCFKILSTYAPALDSAGETLATIIKDEPYEYADGTPVSNWWGDYYRGDMTMREAIEQSANICAVKTLTEITPQLGFTYCQNFGLSTLVESRTTDEGQVFTDIHQSLALGGITDGVYNYEMCAAYAAIANGGVYQEPIMYTKILDHDGNVLLDRTQTQEKRTVLKESTAYLLTSAMEGVLTEGTGTPARLSNMAAAGKTGTTSNNVDLWFSGYTPYYTCTIWTGYDDNTPLADQEWNYHLRMWKKIMDQINTTKGLSYTDFETPDSVVERTVCTSTGKLAVSGCPSVTEYFDKDTAPTESCSGHRTTRRSTSSNSESSDSSDQSEDSQSSESSDSSNSSDSESSSDSGNSSSSDSTQGSDNTSSDSNSGGTQSDDSGGDSASE
ncbi:PBP1A family penicillin-binding protein [Drancourtella massiliensis]|uniref:Penicillin-binding protein 1A n=1 Tax=Drancourtella massiliensis TaxID=1632013 RepID=A0ABS2EH46_9FIRM|nr:PBP1A family penicillin-binding protein [Drancourtella massiliensis]MBM6744310.1 PBP1A family penicillin-binding protein [Drancourtella massiliensis]